jgi:hypothetical protein
MGGDYSRRRFDKNQDFSAVLNQQGRVQLDSDWNEFSDILSRRIRAETVGVMGPAVVPTEGGPNAGAFEIKPNAATTSFTIGAGRMYVDGLLAENHGSGETALFDTVLEELRYPEPVDYNGQLHLPNAQMPTVPGQYAVYLDVWQREVTSLEAPAIVENAVGVDTTTRLQTVWQVKLQLLDAGEQPSCATTLPFQPSDGRLSTAAVGVASQTDLCKLPPSGGYRGLENRLYRVEIHDGGPVGQAYFKWSRDNASLATAVTAISPDGITFTVSTLARDSVLAFAPGDWIEVTNDTLEFSSQPGLPNQTQGGGRMAKISDVNPSALTISLESALTVNDFTDSLGNLYPHTRVQRWDQRGQVFDTSHNLLVDLDAPGSNAHIGLIPVPMNGTSIVLEDGVQITFDAGEGEYHVADHWNFAARTADASVEELIQAPPRGVHHHFSCLALMTLIDGTISVTNDCRAPWPSPQTVKVQEEGKPVGSRNTLNFIGAGVSVTDDALNDRINITIPGTGLSESSPTRLLFPYVTTAGNGMVIVISNTIALPYGLPKTSGGKITVNYFSNISGYLKQMPPRLLPAGQQISISPEELLNADLTNFEGYAIVDCDFAGAYGYAYFSFPSVGPGAYLAITLPEREIVPVIMSLTLPITVDVNGGDWNGTVTLNVPAPAGGIEVTISSDRTSDTVEPSVTIKSGDIKGDFKGSSKGNVQKFPRVVTITATQTINIPDGTSQAIKLVGKFDVSGTPPPPVQPS